MPIRVSRYAAQDPDIQKHITTPPKKKRKKLRKIVLARGKKRA